MHVNEEVPNLKEKYPHIPSNLIEFIIRALIKDPQRRISSWDKIIELLKPNIKTATVKPEKNKTLDVSININVHRITDKNITRMVESVKRLLTKNKLDFSISTSEVKTVFQYSNDDK